MEPVAAQLNRNTERYAPQPAVVGSAFEQKKSAMNAGTVPAEETSYNINIQSSVIYDLPAARFDLPGWLWNFSTKDYERSTPASGAHRYCSVYRDGDGGPVYRNDEFVGGFMMTQFYRERIMEPQRVRLKSMTRARSCTSGRSCSRYTGK